MSKGTAAGFFQVENDLIHVLLKRLALLLLFVVLAGPAKAYDDKDEVRDLEPEGKGAELALAEPAKAYDYKDVVRDLEPEGKGAELAVQYVSYLQRFVNLADKDENAHDLFHLVREAILDFDLSNLYQSDHFSQWDNGFYGISVKGDVDSEGIDLQMITHKEALETCEEGRGFGSFTSEFAIRKNLNPPVGRLSDTLVADGNWISGNIDWTHTTRFLDNLMRVLDPDNLDTLRQQRDIKPGDDFDVMDVFRENFPRLFIDKQILDLSSTAAVKSVDGCRYTDFILKVGSDPKGIKEFFPLVAKYMKKMNKHGAVDIIVKDKQGRTLLGLFFGAQKDFFRLEVCTRDGMVIPVDTVLDRPVMSDAYSVSSLKDYTYESHVTMSGKALGMKIRISNQIVDGEFFTDGENMRFAQKMSNKADTRISGAILGIIPIAIINMVIPGTVQGLADDFSTIMFQANRGEGTMFGAEWKIREPCANRLYWRGQTELPDNDFIRIGMRMFARMFLMDQETFDEFRMLISMGMDFLLLDLYSMRM